MENWLVVAAVEVDRGGPRGDALLVAEVRQHDEHAVDLVAVAAKEIGAPPSLGVGLDAAKFRLGGRDHHGGDARGLQHGQHLGAGLADELVWKEIAIADDHAERGRRRGHACSQSSSGAEEPAATSPQPASIVPGGAASGRITDQANPRTRFTMCAAAAWR